MVCGERGHLARSIRHLAGWPHVSPGKLSGKIPDTASWKLALPRNSGSLQGCNDAYRFS
jgi:hypothetical protein